MVVAVVEVLPWRIVFAAVPDRYSQPGGSPTFCPYCGLGQAAARRKDSRCPSDPACRSRLQRDDTCMKQDTRPSSVLC